MLNREETDAENHQITNQNNMNIFIFKTDEIMQESPFFRWLEVGAVLRLTGRVTSTFTSFQTFTIYVRIRNDKLASLILEFIIKTTSW